MRPPHAASSASVLRAARVLLAAHGLAAVLLVPLRLALAGLLIGLSEGMPATLLGGLHLLGALGVGWSLWGLSRIAWGRRAPLGDRAFWGVLATLSVLLLAVDGLTLLHPAGDTKALAPLALLWHGAGGALAGWAQRQTPRANLLPAAPTPAP